MAVGRSPSLDRGGRREWVRGPDDVVWAPLPAANLALVMGREGHAFRARERRSAAALARIVDTRFREVTTHTARLNHPSLG